MGCSLSIHSPMFCGSLFDEWLRILELYGKIGVFTENILQGARKLVRDQLNVQYTMGLKIMMEKMGHKVKIDTAERKEVLQSM